MAEVNSSTAFHLISDFVASCLETILEDNEELIVSVVKEPHQVQVLMDAMACFTSRDTSSMSMRLSTAGECLEETAED